LGKTNPKGGSDKRNSNKIEKKKKRIKHPVKENGYKFIFLAYVEGGALGSIIYFGSADRQAGRQAGGRAAEGASSPSETEQIQSSRKFYWIVKHCPPPDLNYGYIFFK